MFCGLLQVRYASHGHKPAGFTATSRHDRGIIGLVEHHYALDYAEGDRHNRAIMLHMVLSLVVGMVLGAVGALLAHGPGLVYSIYEPYAYVLLVVVVGRTASGLGWAVLASALAVLGPFVSLLVASLFGPDAGFFSLGTNGPIMNLALLTLTSLGVLAYFTGRDDVWADVAGGMLAGTVAIDGLDKTAPGGLEYVSGFWPWNTLVVGALTLGLLLVLRGRGGLARSAFVALIVACAVFVFAVGL